MANVDFIIQRKGGVGKSVTATLLYQALLEAGRTVEGVDTDPSNKSLAGYKALKVTKLHILNDEEDIDKSLFDALIESMSELPKDVHVVIDNGSSNFVPLRSYMKTCDIPQVLTEMGHEVKFHVVIAGGPDLENTCSGFKELAVDFPETKLVPWLNPYNGDIAGKDGKSFKSFRVAQDHAEQIFSTVTIPKCCQTAMFRKDLQRHFSRQQTFAEAMNSPLPIVERHRLKRFWDETKKEIGLAGLV